MREYKITKSTLWRIIYKKRQKDKMIYVWFLWARGRVLDKTFAKIFYNEEDAISALVINKMRDGKDAD